MNFGSSRPCRATLGGSTVLTLALLSSTAAGQTYGAQATSGQVPSTRPVIQTVGQLYDLIEAQRLQIEAQQRRIENLERAIHSIAGQAPYQYGAPQQPQPYPGQTPPNVTYVAAPASQQAQTGATPETPVGEEDPEADLEQLDIAGLREAGGVLTPEGVLVIEPSIAYESSSTTRFFFNGIEVVDTVLIGDIEVTDADRSSITAAAAFRYGITDRSEVEIQVPFVYRSDDVTTQDLGGGGTDTNSLDGANLGDVEVSGRYQINDGREGWPVFVGNLRVKTPSGQGPYDVDRDDEGLETELSTGSGFWAVEPGVTAVLRTDPAVYYASASYLWHIGEDVDEMVGDSHIGDVDPGDVIGLGFGMGLAINERTSLSIGYQHSFVMETEQEIDGATVESDSFDVGALNLGFSYALSDRTSVNLTTQVGVTEDAPDVVLTLRVPTAVLFE